MLLIYSQHTSTRLRYITKQIFDRILGIHFELTTKIEDFVAHDGPKFSYGKQPLGHELFLQSVDLLFEAGVNEEIIKVGRWENIPCFFNTKNQESVVPFDILAAGFYMLSRYEEYLPQMKDELGRFLPTSSLAYENNFLKLPVVDIWAYKFKKILVEKFPQIKLDKKKFTTEVICEVNEAFAYSKKGWIRSIEGIFLDLTKFRLKQIFIRLKVILGVQKDPYHTYSYIINKTKTGSTKLRFFFGLGNFSVHEKSTDHHSQTYQNLVKSIADYCKIGLRLSYDALISPINLKNEKTRFERITHRTLSTTYCQYSRINLPATYRELLEKEVIQDYSMGYPDYSGFRAGTCSPFLFYDLDYEIQTPLLVKSYCLSENAFHKITDPSKAIAEANKLIETIKQVNGRVIFHINNQLFDRTDYRSQFWKVFYDYFVNL